MPKKTANANYMLDAVLLMPKRRLKDTGASLQKSDTMFKGSSPTIPPDNNCNTHLHLKSDAFFFTVIMFKGSTSRN
jgi:hypothetical protein